MGTVATTTVTPGPPAQPKPNEPFEYTKALFADINGWYKDAHGRAQAILALDGTFVTILAGLVVLKGEDLTKLITGFERDTEVALIVMSACFTVSFAFALSALMPRDLWRAESLYKQQQQQQQQERSCTGGDVVVSIHPPDAAGGCIHREHTFDDRRPAPADTRGADLRPVDQAQVEVPQRIRGAGVHWPCLGRSAHGNRVLRH
jgi:hypothetical protein